MRFKQIAYTSFILLVILLVGCQPYAPAETDQPFPKQSDCEDPDWSETWHSEHFSEAKIENGKLMMLDKNGCEYEYPTNYLYELSLNEEYLEDINYCNAVTFAGPGGAPGTKKYYCYNNENNALKITFWPIATRNDDKNIFLSILDNINLKYDLSKIFSGELVQDNTIKKINCLEYEYVVGPYTPHGIGGAKKTKECDNFIIHIGDPSNKALYQIIEFTSSSPWITRYSNVGIE